jgi:hypothetical protein
LLDPSPPGSPAFIRPPLDTWYCERIRRKRETDPQAEARIGEGLVVITTGDAASFRVGRNPGYVAISLGNSRAYSFLTTA